MAERLIDRERFLSEFFASSVLFKAIFLRHINCSECLALSTQTWQMNRIVDWVLPAPLGLHHRTWRLLLLNHKLLVRHHSATKHSMHLRVHINVKQVLVRYSMLIRVRVDHTDVLQLLAVKIVHGTSSVRRKRQVRPVSTYVNTCSHRVPFVTAVLILELP